MNKIVSLKLSETLSSRLDRAARESNQSKSAVVREALEVYLAKKESPKPQSVYDLISDLVGTAEGPGDLSTNPKYMEGFGE